MPALSISSDDDTDSTELDGEYDSELNPKFDVRMEDDGDPPDSTVLGSDVHLERDSDNGEGEDDEEEDEKQEDKGEEQEEEEEEDKDAEEDKDEDDGTEPGTIGQEEIVNTSADNVEIRVDDQQIVLPEHGQEMREHTPRPHPQAPATRPSTLDPR